MKRCKPCGASLGVVCLLLISAEITRAQSADRILTFQSEITVARDRTLTVSETFWNPPAPISVAGVPIRPNRFHNNRICCCTTCTASVWKISGWSHESPNRSDRGCCCDRPVNRVTLCISRTLHSHARVPFGSHHLNRYFRQSPRRRASHLGHCRRGEQSGFLLPRRTWPPTDLAMEESGD